jgi:hypothetical protein
LASIGSIGSIGNGAALLGAAARVRGIDVPLAIGAPGLAASRQADVSIVSFMTSAPRAISFDRRRELVGKQVVIQTKRQRSSPSATICADAL